MKVGDMTYIHNDAGVFESDNSTTRTATTSWPSDKTVSVSIVLHWHTIILSCLFEKCHFQPMDDNSRCWRQTTITKNPYPRKTITIALIICKREKGEKESGHKQTADCSAALRRAANPVTKLNSATPLPLSTFHSSIINNMIHDVCTRQVESKESDPVWDVENLKTTTTEKYEIDFFFKNF